MSRSSLPVSNGAVVAVARSAMFMVLPLLLQLRRGFCRQRLRCGTRAAVAAKQRHRAAVRFDAKEGERKSDQQTRAGKKEERRRHGRGRRARMHEIIRARDQGETQRTYDLADPVRELGKAHGAPGKL